MPDWDQGYVSELEYPGGFHREQTPALLNLASLINGFAPVETAGGFSYCELGCGQGVTLCLLAAANPQGQFHGVDFMPEHIERARNVAAAAGLDNVTFHEAAFEDLESGDHRLPAFDFVALHGVYTWVSPQTQATIRRFLAHHLRTGGIAYVSVNVLPGWEPALTLQRLLLEIGGLVRQPARQRLERAVSLLARLRDAGAVSLAKSPVLDDLVSRVAEGDVGYLIHEYFAGHWRPLIFADLARDMAEAKLTHVGSATIQDTVRELTLTPEQCAVLDEIGAPEVAETLVDTLRSQRFRRDVFRRGAARLDRDRRARLLQDVVIAAVVTPSEMDCALLRVPPGAGIGAIELYGPACAALADGPQRLGDLLDLASRHGHAISAASLAGALVGSGQAMPALAGDAVAATPAIRRFNMIKAAPLPAVHRRLSHGLAAAALAGGIAVNGVAAAAYRLLAPRPSDAVTAESLAAEIWRGMQARGQQLMDGDKPVEGEDATLARLRERTGRILAETVPLWRRLGVI